MANALECRDEIRRDPPTGCQPQLGASSRGLGTDILAAVQEIRLADGPDLVVWGSSTLTPVLLGHQLVDELVLIVYPVLLGRGKRFFSDRVDARELAFVSTKSTPTGVLTSTLIATSDRYEPDPAGRPSGSVAFVGSALGPDHSAISGPKILL